MPALEPTILRTARLVLRPPVAEDAPALFAVFSDPRVMRYWSSPAWVSPKQAQASIAADAADRAAGAHLRFGIELPAEGRLVGTCTIFAINHTCRRAELGYALASPLWGNGYMHEALTALVAHAFDTLALNRLEADIDPRNAPSARSLARLGFRLEGRLRERWIVAGEVSDSDLYGLLRSDWDARQAPASERCGGRDRHGG